MFAVCSWKCEKCQEWNEIFKKLFFIQCAALKMLNLYASHHLKSGTFCLGSGSVMRFHQNLWRKTACCEFMVGSHGDAASFQWKPPLWCCKPEAYAPSLRQNSASAWSAAVRAQGIQGRSGKKRSAKIAWNIALVLLKLNLQMSGRKHVLPRCWKIIIITVNFKNSGLYMQVLQSVWSRFSHRHGLSFHWLNGFSFRAPLIHRFFPRQRYRWS